MLFRSVPESDTPAAVKSAAFKRYPNAKIVGFAKEIQGDGADAKVLFELKLKELERKWEAAFSPEGKWVEEEESLKKTDLPSSVKQGLQKERPKAKILEVLKKTTAAGDSSHAVYHVDIKNGRSKESLSFNESGSLLYNKAKEDEKEAAKGTNNPERKSREAPAKETKEGTAR